MTTRTSYAGLVALAIAALCTLLHPVPTYAMPPCAFPDRVDVKITKLTEPGQPTKLIAALHVASPNAIRSITFGQLSAAVLVDTTRHPSSGETLTFAPNTTEVYILVTRLPGHPGAFVPFTVHDTCGDWPSFIGGGPGAF